MLLNDPRIQDAIKELQGIIRERYPEADIVVGYGEEPVGIYLTATVDVEDTDEVTDLYIHRLVELQVEEQLPVYVIPVRLLERQKESDDRSRSRGQVRHSAI
jgi:hypothetical protein